MNLKNFSLFLLLTVIISGFLSFNNYKNHEVDWDLPGYLGSYYATQYDNTQVVHQNVYGDIQKIASPTEWNNITKINQKSNIRYSFYSNAQSFSEQLPYYQVKVLYNLSIQILVRLGFAPVEAAFVANAFFYFWVGILFLLITYFIFPNWTFFSFSLTTLLLSLPITNAFARMASPDLLSILLLLIFFLVYLWKNSEFLLFLILALLTLTRPDYLVFGVTFYGLQLVTKWLINKKFDFSAIMYSIFLIAIYFFVIKCYHYPGWKEVFYDSFIHRREFISKEIANFSFEDYLGIVLKNLMYMKKISLFAILFLGASLKFSRKIEQKLFAIFIFINIYLKFLMFPAAGEYRFFYGLLMVLFFWTLFLFSQRFRKLADLKT